jgi:hypothetical protein
MAKEIAVVFSSCFLITEGSQGFAGALAAEATATFVLRGRQASCRCGSQCTKTQERFFIGARACSCMASLILSGGRSKAQSSLKKKWEKPTFAVFHFGTLFSQNLTICLSGLRSQQLLFPLVQRATKQTWRLDDATSAP